MDAFGLGSVRLLRDIWRDGQQPDYFISLIGIM